MSDEQDKPQSVFAEVQRQAKERRAVADRRAQARRAEEMREVARQLAIRQAAERKPPVNADTDSEPLPEAIKDDPA